MLRGISRRVGRDLGRIMGRGMVRWLELLLAPGVCLACGCDPGDSSLLCTSCRTRIDAVPNPCHYCGQPNPLAGIVCPACRLNPPRWQRMIAPLQYRGITRDYLLQLKHSQATHLAKGLCRHSLTEFRQNWPRPQVLLPVPLHRNPTSGREVRTISARVLKLPSIIALHDPAHFIGEQLANSSKRPAEFGEMIFIFAAAAVHHSTQLVGPLLKLPDTAAMKFAYWRPRAPTHPRADCGCPDRARGLSKPTVS